MPGKITKSKKATQLIPSETDKVKEIIDCLKNNVDYYDKQIKHINNYDDACNQEKTDELKEISKRFYKWHDICQEKVDEYEDAEQIKILNNKLLKVKNSFMDKEEHATKKIENLIALGPMNHARYGGMQSSSFDQSNDSNGQSFIDENRFKELDLQTQEEDAVNEAILREREEDIKDINKKVHDVHEVFKDLADLVDQQQEDIDQIERNVDQAHENTKEGVKQLEKAAEYQTSCIIC